MHPQTIFHQRPSLLRPNCILGDRRVRSEQYAWFPFVEPGPSKSFDRGRLKVSVPAQFQRNSRSEGPGPRRGKSSLCQCALRQKKAEPTTRVHEVHTRREFGRVSVIRSGAPSATASARSFSRLVGPVGVRRAARTPPTRPTGMPVAANKICALTRTAVSRNLDFCRKKRKQRASPRSRAARSQVLRLVE